MRKIIQTDKAAPAIGPYSQAICLGGLLYTSGQIPVHPQSGAIPADFPGQVEQVLQNLAAIAQAAGTSLDKAVKTMCFLTDMANFAVFNEIYARYFTQNPARSCIAVKALPKGVMVEVEAIIEC